MSSEAKASTPAEELRKLTASYASRFKAAREAAERKAREKQEAKEAAERKFQESVPRYQAKLLKWFEDNKTPIGSRIDESEGNDIGIEREQVDVLVNIFDLNTDNGLVPAVGILNEKLRDMDAGFAVDAELYGYKASYKLRFYEQ